MFESTFNQQVTTNWDIEPLAAKIVSMPNNSGILQDGRRTVTVEGKVYLQEEVNYFIYGVWARVIGKWEWATNLRIGPYRYVFQDGKGIAGREAWFHAGYIGDLSAASQTAIHEALPSGQIYDQTMHFWVGVNPWRMEGDK